MCLFAAEAGAGFLPSRPGVSGHCMHAPGPLRVEVTFEGHSKPAGWDQGFQASKSLYLYST